MICGLAACGADAADPPFRDVGVIPPGLSLPAHAPSSEQDSLHSFLLKLSPDSWVNASQKSEPGPGSPADGGCLWEEASVP